MDAQGKILEQRNLRNDPDPLRGYLTQQPPDTRFAGEATGNWMSLYELIEARDPDLVLAPPLKTKAIASARIKTDKIDSTILAHFLRTDLLPAAYIPPRAVRDTREVLRYSSRPRQRADRDQESDCGRHLEERPPPADQDGRGREQPALSLPRRGPALLPTRAGWLSPPAGPPHGGDPSRHRGNHASGHRGSAGPVALHDAWRWGVLGAADPQRDCGCAGSWSNSLSTPSTGPRSFGASTIGSRKSTAPIPHAWRWRERCCERSTQC